MQRTAVIYGLALSTLVGAFLLMPKMVTPPEPPKPPPPPKSDAPITKLVYGDGTLEVTATLDRGHLATGSLEPVWMDVAIKAAGAQARAPLAAVLVIDRSGSMAGDKIDDARQAAERFVNGMVDGDMLSIVTYGSDVSVDLPFVTVDKATKGRALSIVRHIEEGGGTNIDGGLLAAKSQLASANTSGKVARVVLLSDGRPTEGDRRTATLVGHASALRQSGVTTSTIGLGLDYNEDLMEGIAVDGGGRYHYIKEGKKTGAQMAQVLDAELQHGRNVVASGVKLHLPRGLASGLTVLGAPGQKDIGNGDKLVVDVGDLASGEERHVLVKIDVQNVTAVGFAAPEIVYAKAGTDAPSLVAQRADAFRLIPTADLAVQNAGRNDDVRVRVLQVEASLALTTSMTAWQNGDANKAKEELKRAKAEVEAAAKRTGNATLMREARNFDDVLIGLDAPAPATAASQDMVKAQKARAFDLRR